MISPEEQAKWRKVGAMIRAARIASGGTQEWLAAASGCSRSMIAMLETGRTHLTWRKAVSIGKQLGVDAEALYYGRGP